MNKDFLKRHFGSGKGNLYEAYLQDIDERVEQDNGDDQSREDLRALYNACLIDDSSGRWERLDEILDIDRFPSFVAMELLTSHWDGYAMQVNNYRIYHDPKSDKMVFITHGLDATFRRPNLSIEPSLKSLVARAVLTTPLGEELYQERIEALFASVFDLPVICTRMDKALSKIRSSGLSAPDIAEIARRAGLIRERIELRARRVAEQLCGIEPETMQFDAAGFGYPVSWRDEPDSSGAILDRVKAGRRDTLHIRGREGQKRASWRSQIFLKPGWYRFEGMARMTMNSGPARLRISGDTRNPGVPGNGTWQRLSHDFAVHAGGLDVELVCELNALRGDVWFDLGSLRVKQLSAPDWQSTNRLPVLQK